MEKIVVFGTGSGAKKAMKGINYENTKIVGVIDNNKNMHGKTFYDVIISGPEILDSIEYDKIMICSTALRMIKDQLKYNYNVNDNKIVNKLYFVKNKLLNIYNSLEKTDCEINEILNFLQINDLDVFNYPFRNKYYDLSIDVQWDKDANMFYIMHNNKRMYFKRSFNTIESVIEYYRFISQEQDYNSPHHYFTSGMDISTGDVVIDAGVAEGNFALDVIDKVSKIYLIETDADWIEALKYTFKNYKDKVILINKFLSNKNEQNSITLDNVIGDETINYIKMDIEGEEYNALHGAINILTSNDNLKLNLCIYHNKEDEIKIGDFLHNLNYKINITKGYMVFVNDKIYDNDNPCLVRGLLQAKNK